MRKQHYYPKQLAARPEWHGNFARGVEELGTQLGLSETEVTIAVQDNRYLEWALGSWLVWVRTVGKVGSAAVKLLCMGKGTAPYAMPTPVPPPTPENVVPVPQGALTRTHRLVQRIKASPTYAPHLGKKLGIIGAENSAQHPHPKLTLNLERGAASEFVRVKFTKYHHVGIVLYGRRGDGEWEKLNFFLRSPAFDRRPLLVADQPEIREYRALFLSTEGEVGEWSPTASITVSP